MCPGNRHSLLSFFPNRLPSPAGADRSLPAWPGKPKRPFPTIAVRKRGLSTHEDPRNPDQPLGQPERNLSDVTNPSASPNEICSA